jgi:hypothetical protein
MEDRIMWEACFRGREGAIEGRAPVNLGDGDWGLACPECDHLDRLAGWPEAARRCSLAEAARRHKDLAEADAFVRPVAAGPGVGRSASRGAARRLLPARCEQ